MARKLRNRCNRNVNRKSLFYLYILSWLLVGYAKTNEVCGKFRIETFNIKDNVLYEGENTNVNITFTIITNSNCKAFTDIAIDVSKWDAASAINSKIFIPQCTIWQTSKMCRGSQNSNVRCMCLLTNAHYSYSVIKEVSASDKTPWKLSTADNSIEDLIFDFRKTVKTTESSELQRQMYDDTSTLEITQTEHTITLFSSAMLKTTSVNSEFSNMSRYTESNDKNVTMIIIYAIGSAIFVAVVTGIITSIIVMKIYRKADTGTGMKIDQSSNEHLDTPNRPIQDNRNPRCIEIGPNVEATLYIKGCPGTSLQTQNMTERSLNPDLTLVPFEQPKVEDDYYIDICE